MTCTRYGFPRTDLAVTLDGIHHQAGRSALDGVQSGGGDAMAVGDLVLSDH